MSTPGPSTAPPTNAALDLSGLTWVAKRLKVPSRNTLIFLSVTSSVLGLYIYDRQQCKKIRQEYVDKVRHLSEETTDHLAWPRQVKVYSAKWPGDEDYNQCARYFRKYVKPIFIAAAIDFEIVTGKKHGDLADRIADEIKMRRRLDMGLEEEHRDPRLTPKYKFRSKEDIRQQELDGGIVIVGRPTWKEFMDGLKRGWTESPAKIDHDEILARELEEDGRFDEVEPFEETPPSPAKSFNSDFYNTLHQASPKPTASSPVDSTIPSSIPALPPILFVPFTNYVGFKLIPNMLYDFFNRRYFVQSGAEAAYRLVMRQTRPFNPPSSVILFNDVSSEVPSTSSDVDFGKHSEGYYKNSLNATEKEVERQRRKYYDELVPKLATARELARHIREPTKDEINYPPATEVELRAERMEKEKRWRRMLSGWEIVKPSTEVAWDNRFEGIFTVFTDPTEKTGSNEDTSTKST
ncbi:mitochondrial import inner membrane translocase subunit TIM54 [Mucidula mucida]|nr:mitochondrial import inner membrane translocase subunit TIM54 [Mucidula mucida]